MPKERSECYPYVVHGTLKRALLLAQHPVYYIYNYSRSGWCLVCVCVSALGKLNNAVDMTLIIKLTCKRHCLLMKAKPGVLIYFGMPRRCSIMNSFDWHFFLLHYPYFFGKSWEYFLKKGNKISIYRLFQRKQTKNLKSVFRGEGPCRNSKCESVSHWLMKKFKSLAIFNRVAIGCKKY